MNHSRSSTSYVAPRWQARRWLLASVLVALALILTACRESSLPGSDAAILSAEDRAEQRTPYVQHELAHLRVPDARAVAWSPDGSQIAVSSGARVMLYSADLSAARMLEGHTQAVRALAWSPDGARIASASLDGTVRIWDVTADAAGTAPLTLTGHTAWVLGVAWSPDGATLASAGTDGTARLWDAADGTERLSLNPADGASVTAVAWSPDGTQVATGSSDNRVRLWDAATGEPVLDLSQHKDVITAVAWSPDGARLVSASWDTTLIVWDAARGEVLQTMTDHIEVVSAAAWSPDGTRIASASRDDSIRLWEAATAATTAETATLTGHTAEVSALSWSPDGRYLASTGLDNMLRLWDCGVALNAHTRLVSAVAWAPGGAQPGAHLLTASTDGSVRVWDTSAGADLSTSTVLYDSADALRAAVWSPDGARIAAGSESGMVHVWDAASGQSVLDLPGHTQWVTAVTWSPDGAWVAAGSWDRALRVWDAASGAEQWVVTALPGAVESLDWSPDGAALAVSTQSEPTVLVLDAHTGATQREFATGWGGAVAWSPDGSRLAMTDRRVLPLVAETTPSALTVQLWDALRVDLPLSGGLVYEVLDADASVSTRGSVTIVSLPDGAIGIREREGQATFELWDGDLTIQVARGQGKPLVTLALRPGSPITRSWEGSLNQIELGTSTQVQISENLVMVWDMQAEDEAPVQMLAEHTSWVTALAWSPDGAYLASASTDRTVVIWDMTSGEPVTVLQGTGDSITGLAWSPADASRGTRMAAAAGTRVWVWGE